MKAVPVDPRDTVWEQDAPAYRVSFWNRTSSHPGSGWACEEWRLSEIDVREVLDWAGQQADGRQITVWVEHDDTRDGRGMVRLLGWEPTRTQVRPYWTS